MSRGFVKEEDQEEVPRVPPRADLPPGIINYVTPQGLKNLLSERESIQLEKDTLSAENENERRIALHFINAKLQLLNERIVTAKRVDLSKQPQDEIRFGAWITLKVNDQNEPLRYQIVGVDEAHITPNKISFLSPLAHLLIDKKRGQEAVLQLANSTRIFKVLRIEYTSSEDA